MDREVEISAVLQNSDGSHMGDGTFRMTADQKKAIDEGDDIRISAEGLNLKLIGKTEAGVYIFRKLAN